METYRMDDRDPAVVYSRPDNGHHWTDNGSSSSYAGTLRLTRTRGATARVTFEGTSISVYGLISERGVGRTPRSTYAIDSGPAITYTAQETSQVQSQVLFYNSGTLAPGTHTLYVTNDEELDYFWIDSFEVTGNPASDTRVGDQPIIVTTTATTPESSFLSISTITQTNTLPGASNSTQTGQSNVAITRTETRTVQTGDSGPGIATIYVSDQPTSSAAPISGLGGQSDPNIGAIVAGTLGALAVLILCALGVALWQRRHREASHGLDEDEHGHPPPYSDVERTPPASPVTYPSRRARISAIEAALGTQPMTTTDARLSYMTDSK